MTAAALQHAWSAKEETLSCEGCRQWQEQGQAQSLCQELKAIKGPMAYIALALSC